MRKPWRYAILGACLLLLIVAFSWLRLQWDERAYLAHIERAFVAVRQGDSKEDVLTKLGSPNRVFPVSAGFPVNHVEQWAYGRTTDVFPSVDFLRRPVLGFERTRPFGPARDDFVVKFDENGLVKAVGAPVARR